RLNAEIVRHLQTEADELAAILETERASAAADAARTTREAAELEIEQRIAAAVGVSEAQRSASDAVQHAASARVTDAVRSIDSARSLTEVLDALVTGACSESPRVALLLVDGARLRTWRFSGFGWAVDNRPSVELPLSDAGALGLAVRT